MTRGAVWVVAAAVVITASGAVCAAQSAAVTDTRLKAALVSKFPQFVEWPSDGAPARAPLVVCVATPDPFGSDLNDLLDGVTVNSRPVVARRVERESDLAGCHVLYLPSRPGHHPSDLLRAVLARPILTVSDDGSFLDDGGIIQLRLVEGRMRFDVNAGAARRVGLKISSQLLQLAMTVRGASPR